MNECRSPDLSNLLDPLLKTICVRSATAHDFCELVYNYEKRRERFREPQADGQRIDDLHVDALAADREDVPQAVRDLRIVDRVEPSECWSIATYNRGRAARPVRLEA